MFQKTKPRYQPAYKCPLCDKLTVVGKPFEIDYDDLPKLLASVVKNQQFAGNPYLHQVPMFIPCKCRNKDAGLAQFAGFIKVD